MKKILIMASSKSEKKERFLDFLKNYFENEAEVILGTYADLAFTINQGSVNVEMDKKNIKDFDLVYFRNTSHYQSMAATLSIYLDAERIEFFDRVFLSASFVGDKFTSLMRLATNNVPIVTSFLCSGTSIEKNMDKIVELLGYPVVAKEVTTQRMQSIYLIKSKEDFKSLPEKNLKGSTAKYLFQKFISIDREFRVLVLGDAARVVHTKTVRDNSGFKVGYSDINEYPEFIRLEDTPRIIKDTAVGAAKSLDIQIAGVDICREKETGKIFVIEVNRGPGFEYNTSISPELTEVAAFIKKEVNKDD
jgi:glutathione synthase/RimK-type ligase-like ATP-grasp enzyme